MLFLSPSLEMKEKKVLFAFSKTEFLLVDQEDLIHQLPFRDLSVFDSNWYIMKNSEFLKFKSKSPREGRHVTDQVYSYQREQIWKQAGITRAR